MFTDFTYMHWVLSPTARAHIDYKTKLCSFAAVAMGMVFETKLSTRIPLPVITGILPLVGAVLLDWLSRDPILFYNTG